MQPPIENLGYTDEFWTNDLRLANAAQGHLQIVTFESTP